VVDAGAFSGLTTTSTSALINTYSFITTETAPVVAPGALGSSYEGGYVICKASGLAWIVSPYSAEVSRTWYLRNDANTTAQSVSGCTGWFVPTYGQLMNPGYLCRSFWDCCSPTEYWSSPDYDANVACTVHFSPRGGGSYSTKHKACTCCVRAFRCVTY
jgi:hypothetical protein